MRLKMIFKLGVTVVIAVAVIIVYVRHTDPDNEQKGQGHDKGDHVGQGHVNNQNNEVNIQDTGQGHKKDQGDLSDLKSKNVINDAESKPDPKISSKEKHQNSKNEENDEDSGLEAVFSSAKVPPKNVIHLAVVACGDRKDETLILLKSAVIFTTHHMVFHIFTETHLQKSFKEELEFWPEKYLSRLDFFIYNITFPTGGNSDEWKKLFKPCASQRLFLPVLLTSVDSLIYVDTDILFLRPLQDLWSHFERFNATQLAALSPEHEDKAAGWYNRFARHPYYGLLGLNSGVMLMNLTRLRNSKWLPSMIEYYKEYKLKIAWGDQDLINIYFHYYPEQVYVYGCEWNYRSDHCMYMSVCKAAETEGASVLHGSRRVMHNDKQPAFKAVYDAFKEHRLGDDIQYKLLVQIERNLKTTESTRCGKVGYILSKQIKRFCEVKNKQEKKEGAPETNKQPPHPPS